MKAKMNFIDKVVSYFNPKEALSRVNARLALSSLENNGYISSSSPMRSMRGWQPSSNSADADILPKLDSLRSCSRDLYMNAPIATGALRRIKTNSVGFGLRIQSRIDREILNLSDQKAEDWERKTEREFLSWAESQDCDAARTLNFFQLTGLAFFTTLLSGDCFVLLPKIPRKGQIYDLRIQVIEGDLVDNPPGVYGSNKIKSGIEVDQYGAPLYYYFNFPEENGIKSKWVKIPVFGTKSGRRQVLHLYEKERPGQTRGVPILSPVIEELKQLTRLSKAEIQAAIINSYFTVFIKSQSPVATNLSPGFIPSPAGIPGATILNDSDPRDDVLYEMGSGNIIELREGEDITLADPRRPNASFESFFLSIVKQIGSALGIPFEELILHFSASYSASRAALQEAWKFYRERRIWIASYFCQPIYEEWLTEAILSGRINAPGFFKDPVIRKAWSSAVWAGPGQGQLDPLKETKASVLKIQNNLGTYEDEYVAITGNDWEGAVNRRARESSLIKNLGLTEESENADTET